MEYRQLLKLGKRTPVRLLDGTLGYVENWMPSSVLVAFPHQRKNEWIPLKLLEVDDEGFLNEKEDEWDDSTFGEYDWNQ